MSKKLIISVSVALTATIYLFNVPVLAMNLTSQSNMQCQPSVGFCTQISALSPKIKSARVNLTIQYNGHYGHGSIKWQFDNGSYVFGMNDPAKQKWRSISLVVRSINHTRIKHCHIRMHGNPYLSPGEYFIVLKKHRHEYQCIVN